MERNEKNTNPSGKHKVKIRSKDALPLKKKKTKDNVSLLILNDDCLCHIFRYMKIRDIMNAEQTCTRLRGIARVSYDTMKTLEWTSDIPYSCAPKIIVKFGRYTTSLHSLHFNRVRKPKEQNMDYNNFINVLLENCKNLKSLKFDNCDVGYEWAPFFDSLHYLESLSLSYTHLRNSNYLKRVSTLKHFKLEGRSSFEVGKFNYFLANNNRLERLILEDCEYLSRGLRFDILGNLRLKSLSLEVYPENVTELDEIDVDSDDELEEMEKPFRQLKKLKITQTDKKLKLNSFLKKITENATLEQLELFKFNVDENTFPILKAMKLTSFTLYPKFVMDEATLCRMLVDALPNLKHLTLIMFDLDRDLELCDHDMLFLIQGLKKLEKLDLYHCDTTCSCDYVVCPYRCKLRGIINYINEIFQQDIDRPTLKLMLPKSISRTFFHGYRKLQQKYRAILTNRVRLVKPSDLDSPLDDSYGLLNSFFLELLEDEPDVNDASDDDSESNIESGDDSESNIESGDDPESHPASDYDRESDDDQELDSS